MAPVHPSPSPAPPFAPGGVAPARPARRWRTALLVCLLGALAACGRGGGAADTLRIDVLTDEAAARLVAESTGVGLTRADAAGRIVPGLARSWRVSDDGSFIVFRLREAEGADTQTLAGREVARALTTARAGADPLTRGLLAGVSGVFAPLDDVVEVRLSTPQPELLELLARPELAIRPRHRGRGMPPAMPGPFAPAEAAEPGTRRLVADPRFFDAANVGVGSVVLRTAAVAEAVRRFARGETDLVLGGFHAGVSEARVGAPREALVLERARATLFVAINRRRPPLDELAVREALTRVIDRAQIGRAIYGTDAAVPLHGLTPPGLSGYVPPPDPEWVGLAPAERLEEARQRLAEAGFDSMNRLRLRLAIGNSVEEERVATVLVAGWSALGAEVVVEKRSPRGHAAALSEGSFDLALASAEAAIDSPLPFLLGLRCGANAFGLCVEEADRVLASGWEAPTLAERMARLALAERLWQEDVATIPLIQPLRWALVSKRVRGFVPNAGGVHPLAAMRRAD